MPDLSKDQSIELAESKLADAKFLLAHDRSGNAYRARAAEGAPRSVVVIPTLIEPQILLVAAVAENGVIGRGDALPWRLKSDLQHFRALTMGKPVVMGRKTYRSIGRPLSGRTTIVISRDPAFAAPGIVVAPRLEAALEAARGDALRRSTDTVVIAGGAEIYAQTMPLATALAITEVHKRVEGEARFPAIDPAVWQEVARSAQRPGADDEAAFAFVTYKRRIGS